MVKYHVATMEQKYKRCTERQADYLDIFDIETKTIINNPNPINNDDE